MIDTVSIIITVIVGVVLVGVIIFVAIWRVEHNRKQETHHPTVVGVETIVPEGRKNSNGQIFSPETVRAQKFRERARTTTIGKPEFKLSHKKFHRKDIYKTLENHPNFKDFEEFYLEHQHKIGRRMSEDRTSYGNSTIDESETGKHFQRTNSLVGRQLFAEETDNLPEEEQAFPDV